MSDEPTRAGTATAVTPSGIWKHYCEHKHRSAWGAYGYQIGKQVARGFCHEHRDEGERLIGRA